MTSTDDRTGRPKPVRPTPAPAEVMGRALNIGIAGFAFGFLGHWIGTKVGAPDMLAVIGAFIGASAGFYSLYAHVTGRTDSEQDPKSNSE